ncbi:MAG: DUF433 domain-containing protein [Lewinellaceae bacterium]|nr:DUF433 domain-containing protein [Saprospiraceae bacterium]MCB9341436.1 DUF433 domain-containing protein [Lewinellaceae bacterium]
MKYKYITTDPGILGGKPIIKGTRLSVQFILETIASGASIENLLEEFPYLSKETIQEVLNFAANNQINSE